MLRILKIFILLLVFTIHTTVIGQVGNATTTHTNTPTNTVNTNELLRYSLNISATIPQTIINSNGYDIDFGEIKFQIHEVDATDVTNNNDTSNQILVTESNTKQFNKGNSTLIFDMKAPAIATQELSSNRKYRVRLINTGIGNVNTSLNAAEINVSNNALSTQKINKEALHIYPNPTFDKVFISLPVKNIKLHNIEGRFILETTSSNFSIKNLISGLYIATIETKNGYIYKHKLVKQ